MRWLHLFKKFPDVTDVHFPLPYRFKEYWRTLPFDIGEFQNTETYHPRLALMSFGLSLACFTASDLSKGGEANAVGYLAEAGFKNIVASDDYRHQATTTSLGFVFGRRIVKKGKKKTTLIAVGIRGGHYGAEWGSNAKLGNEGPHQGFYEASERIYREFLAYLKLIKAKGDIAVWTSGFSRAGGVASLFADKLSRGLVKGGPSKRFGKAILNLENIYAYTFGAPKAGEWNGDEYSFIHNVVNPEDIVPRLPFASFGFGHYGFEHNLTCPEDKAEEILARLRDEGIDVYMPVFTAMAIDFRHILDPKKRFVEDFTRDGGQTGFLDQMCGLFEAHLTRESYAKFIQDGMVALGSLVDEQSSSPYEKFTSFLKTILDGVLEDYGLFSLVSKVTSDKTDWKSILEPYLDQAIELEPELEDEKDAILIALAGFLHFLSPSRKELVDIYPTLRDKENAKAIAFAHETVRYYMLLLANQ